MPKYKKFIFADYSFDKSTGQIKLSYSFDDKVHLTEVILLPKNLDFADSNLDDEINRALFALHLAGGVSYYKAYLPQEIEVRSGSLSKEQSKFWNSFYENGLGEFFYLNEIDFRGLVNFPYTETTTPHLGEVSTDFHNALVPFGGGKDSIITSEVLRSAGLAQTLFRVRSHEYIDKLAEVADLPILNIDRQIDRQILEMNSRDALNGHVPITGYITFLSVIVALFGKFDSVWFSNERSADFGSVRYLGKEINHQWSKSIEAEHLLKDYLKNFVTSKVYYASMLRPLGELRIAQMFAKYPKYFEHTTSCNVNWKQLGEMPSGQAWCTSCYKCAFIFALYSAALPGNTSVRIFGKNMFEDKFMLPVFKQLWGEEGMKPFDCVGTFEEMQAAMHLASNKPEFKNSLVCSDFSNGYLDEINNPEGLVDEVLKPDYSGVDETVQGMLEKFT